MVSQKTIIVALFIVLAGIAAAGVLSLASRGTEEAPGAVAALARCLADKGATMYGAYWCSHCKNEKRAFGDAFRFIPYVECTAEPKKCLVAGVEGYPTWILGNDTRLEGEQGLEKLARAAGCAWPVDTE